MVVAINKCDKHNADVKKSKADLLAQGIHLEEYGGDVQAVCISALQVRHEGLPSRVPLRNAFFFRVPIWSLCKKLSLLKPSS